MEEQNSKALLVAFYLSKYDEIAYQKLEFGNKTETHELIGEILSVKPNTVKNMRDQFDSVHFNSRVGWTQRELNPSRINILNSYSKLEEVSLREIVKKILGKEILETNLQHLLESIGDDSISEKSSPNFTSRAKTGYAAESFFSKHWQQLFPEAVSMHDRTKDGCGYDFEVKLSDGTLRYIEVKGMRDSTGGILLTDKEWSVAREHKEKYMIIIIQNLISVPVIKTVINPAKYMKPKMSVQRIIQANWTVSAKELSKSLTDMDF